MVLKFEKEEIIHILVSVITISIAFSMFQGDFWLVLFTLGLGFILHELAHKYVAQRYGAYAVYRAWFVGLLGALGLAIITEGRFILAAPGAVVIYGKHLTHEHNGKIAIAGSVMNLILALIFLSVAYANPGSSQFAYWGAYVNIFLAAFNMIPIFPLDGEKVRRWSEGYWLAISVISWGLFFAVMGGLIPIG